MKSFYPRLWPAVAAVILGTALMAPVGFSAGGERIQQGQLLLGMGRYAEAARMFTQAIEMEGLKAETLLGRGLARLYGGQLELAEEDLTRALEMDPQNPAVFTARGTARFQSGRYAEAIEDYTRALAADNGFAAAYNQLAWALAVAPDKKLRNAERALEMAQKAVDLDPNIHHQDTLAAALAAAGKYTQAAVIQKEVLRRAIQTDQTGYLEAFTARLKRYEEGKPWHLEDSKPPAAQVTQAEQAAPQTPPVAAPAERPEAKPAPETPPPEPAAPPQPEVPETKTSHLAAADQKPASPPRPVPDAAPPAQVQPEALPGTVSIPAPEAEPPSAPPPPAPAPEEPRPEIQAAPAPEAASPSPPPLPARPPQPLPYTIQVSVYPDHQSSNSVVMELRGKGDAAFAAPTQVQGQGVQHRVFIGYYGQISEARAAAEELKKRNFRRTDIVVKPYAVQVGRSDSPLELDYLETQLRDKGYLGYRLPDPEQPQMIRLLVGAYGTEPEALPTAKQLHARGFKSSIVAR